MKTHFASTAALLCFALGASAQTASTPVAAATADVPAAAAGPAKIAVIAFQAVVTQTNEFQRNLGDLQKKYEPKRDELKTLGGQIEALQKTLQTQSSTLNDETRDTDAREISEKQKLLQRDQEDDQNDFQQDMQDSFNKVAAKVGDVLIAYAQEHRFTLVLDGGEQQAQTVLYANPGTDITRAVLDAYNTKSGVPAPAGPPAAVAPARPRSPAQHPAAPQH